MTGNHRTKHHKKDFDVIVVGGGAAGMSAALWCDELGLKTLLLEAKNKLGGQLAQVYNPIKNHLGANAQNGVKLRADFLRQIKNRQFEIRYLSEAVEIDVNAKEIFLSGEKQTLSAEFLIIATGVSRRKLGIEGEDKFKERGILESGKRDEKLVIGKQVCIIGGGDAALENALILSKTAELVFLVHRRANFRARGEFVKQVKANKKVKILMNTTVSKIIGDKRIESVEIKNLQTSSVKILPVEAVLPRIGVKPNTEIFRGKLKLNKAGYIKVDALCRTSVENVFAIGDVACPRSPTISTAVGMGATAAKVISEKVS